MAVATTAQLHEIPDSLLQVSYCYCPAALSAVTNFRHASRSASVRRNHVRLRLASCFISGSDSSLAWLSLSSFSNTWRPSAGEIFQICFSKSKSVDSSGGSGNSMETYRRLQTCLLDITSDSSDAESDCWAPSSLYYPPAFFQPQAIQER